MLKYMAIFYAVLGFAGLAYAENNIQLPADFKKHQIFLDGVTEDDKTIRFFTDTGGGWNMIKESVAKSAGLKEQETLQVNHKPITVFQFPNFKTTSSIPAPNKAYFGNGGLIAQPDDKLWSDGFLGGRWFGGKVWRINYLDETLHYLPGGYQKQAQDKELDLGFHVDKNGERTLHFPRVTVEIAGQSYDLLFDTGATIQLGEDSAKAIGLPEGTRVGGSYINLSILKQWQKAHPDWQVAPQGDTVIGKALPMIRVPKISIAGVEAGPVWFAARPDKNFSEWLSGMMDKPIVGAIGGSGLKYYHLVIDYPKAKLFINGESDEKMSQR